MSAVLVERLLFTRAGILPRPPSLCVPTRRWASSDAKAADDESPTSPYTTSPRTYRGVHRRDQRSKGQTPAEKAMMDEALREIFKTLGTSNDAPGAFALGPLSIFDPSRPTSRSRGGAESSLAPGMKSWSAEIRRRFDREENDDVVEALDELKEEVSEIQTDLELLDWARTRVFPAAPKTFSVDPAQVEPDVDVGEATFPKTYPRILAHLMKVSRQSFNNPHLSLSLFHHAQTLSPESYLSGCLSSAYNELIRTRWECFRDLDGVYRAIREMDENAVLWDKTTQREVGKIVEQVGRDVLERGPGQWGGAEVYVVLDRLERKVQRALRRSEYLDDRAKRDRDRRLFS